MHMKILGLKDKYFYYTIYIFLLLIFSLLVVLNINIAVYGLFWILGFGWSMFFFSKKFNLLIHFLLSPVLFLSTFLPFTILFAFFSIKLTIYVGIAFAVLSCVVFIWRKIFEKENFNLKINKFDWVALFIFVFAVGAKILSVRNFYVPGLHDPISHAYFAKQIMETGLIEYFYSPGIHILGAFSTMFNGFDVARQILFETNYFNAYIGIVAYIFIQRVFKKPIWALSSLLLLCLGYKPALFFVNAGKNALIVGLSILFFIVLLLYENRKKMDWKVILITILAFFAIFVIHYPIAIMACILLFIIFLVDIKKWWLRNFILGIGILLGFTWMLKTYPYQAKQIADSAKVVEDKALYIIPIDFFQSVKIYFNSVVSTLKTTISYLSIAVIVGTILGSLIAIYKCVKDNKFFVFMLWIVVSILSVGIVSIFSISDLGIVLESFLISFFIFWYMLCGLTVSFVFDLLGKKINTKLLMNIFLIWIVLITPLLSYKMYKTFYNRTEAHNVVYESDIKAFDWIKNNTNEDSKFLINASGGNGLVFSTDAGGWLEVFTDRDISSPFYRYSSPEVGRITELYYRIKENNNDCGAIKELIDNGYTYYYQGSKPVFDTRLGSEEKLIGSKRFSLMYSGGESKLYKIIPCK